MRRSITKLMSEPVGYMQCVHHSIWFFRKFLIIPNQLIWQNIIHLVLFLPVQQHWTNSNLFHSVWFSILLIKKREKLFDTKNCNTKISKNYMDNSYSPQLPWFLTFFIEWSMILCQRSSSFISAICFMLFSTSLKKINYRIIRTKHELMLFLVPR